MDGTSRFAALAFMLHLASCLLLQGSCQSISITPNSAISYFQGMDPEVELTCLCLDIGSPFPFTQLDWVHNGSVIDSRSISICTPFSLSFPEVLEFSNAGEYFCRGTLSNGTQLTSATKTVNIIDPSVIQAPPRQFALQHSNTSLNCNVIRDVPFTIISWIYPNETRIPDPTLTIYNADLRNEATYTCDVFLAPYSLTATRDVEFLVIVPPAISAHSKTSQEINGNKALSLEVTFQSRLQESTTVSWFHNDRPIPSNQVQTQYLTEAPNAVTQLSFDPILRQDSGTYKVIITNDFHLIPNPLKEAETEFQVDVVVPPAVPSDLMVQEVSVILYQVTWILTNQTADSGADTLTLTVEASNLTTVYQLEGSETQTTISVVPGMEYQISLIAENQDGTNMTNPISFSTPATAPSPPSSIGIIRVDETTYNLRVGVTYTGGGVITHFVVSFRQLGLNTDFTPLSEIPASPTSPEFVLEWNGIATSEAFRNAGPLEFQVTLFNTAGQNRQIDSVIETTVLPGAPLQPSLISSTISSLTLQVELPYEGTVPFTTIFFVITFPQLQARTENVTGRFYYGDLVQYTFEGLEENTDYIVVAYAANYRGDGQNSPEAAFGTDSVDKSLPIWVIAVIAASVVVTALIVLLTVCLIGKYCHRMKQSQKQYYVSNPVKTADEKTLDASHEMVNRQRKPANFSPLGSGPLTPRGPLDIGGPPNGAAFLYDTSSGNDSEDSYPRYTYTVSTTSPGESLHSLGPRMTSNYSTRESLVCPPAPHTNSTNV